MKQVRTIITFIDFQDIEFQIISKLYFMHKNFGLTHSHGLTTVLINDRIQLKDLGDVDDYVKSIYYEHAYDDPSDIVECMSHSLSGLIDI